MKVIKFNNSLLFIFGTIKGLKSEEEEIRKAYERAKPNVLAIAVSDEELKGLKSIANGKKHEYFLSNYEEIYERKLASYVDKNDKVVVPPPSFLETCRLSKENNVLITAIDMNEEEYAKAYCENISTLELIRHSTRIKKLKKKRFKAANPREFVKEWDKTITKLKGFKILEERRERYMAEKLISLAKNYSKILAVIDMERVDGVCMEIDRMRK